jgi:hypothetical protein
VVQAWIERALHRIDVTGGRRWFSEQRSRDFNNNDLVFLTHTAVAWVVMWRKSLGAMWREWGLPRGACSFAAI